jgi:hypothetical protein
MPGARFFCYSTSSALSCPMGGQGVLITIGYEGPLFAPFSLRPLHLSQSSRIGPSGPMVLLNAWCEL